MPHAISPSLLLLFSVVGVVGHDGLVDFVQVESLGGAVLEDSCENLGEADAGSHGVVIWMLFHGGMKDVVLLISLILLYFKEQLWIYTA